MRHATSQLNQPPRQRKRDNSKSKRFAKQNKNSELLDPFFAVIG